MFLRISSSILLCGLIEASLKGHLEPFGQQSMEPTIVVDEVDGFPNPKLFFHKYVFNNRPLIMRGAAKTSLAWTKWSDEYFMTQAPPSPQGDIYVEHKKKETRSGEGESLHMSKFITSYNYSDIYMVDDLPDWLRSDVIIPSVLQCPYFQNGGLEEAILWFSSGGTSSVVHQDSFENINCIFRGTKTLVFIDPTKYEDLVPQIITKEEGLYNDKIDVDKIDLVKYPVFSKVQYHIGHMHPGDCLYIPYLWIHQVRSFNESNLAVNVWWEFEKSSKVDLLSCNKEMDPKFTFAEVLFMRKRKVLSLLNQLKAFENYLSSKVQNGQSITLTEFIDISLETCSSIKNNSIVITALTEVFNIVDKNGNDVVDSSDFEEKKKFLLHYSRLWQASEKFNKQIKFSKKKDPKNCDGKVLFKDDNGEKDGPYKIKDLQENMEKYLRILIDELKEDIRNKALQLNDFVEFSVDGCSKVAQKKQALTAIKKIFELFDQNSDGIIDNSDFSGDLPSSETAASIFMAGKIFDEQMELAMAADKKDCHGLFFFRENESDNLEPENGSTVEESLDTQKIIAKVSPHTEL